MVFVCRGLLVHKIILPKNRRFSDRFFANQLEPNCEGIEFADSTANRIFRWLVLDLNRAVLTYIVDRPRHFAKQIKSKPTLARCGFFGNIAYLNYIKGDFKALNH